MDILKKKVKGMAVRESVIDPVIDALATHQEAPEGLTERQKRILKLALRGVSQNAMARIEGVSQPMIAKEWAKVKKALAEKGSGVDQQEVVGTAMSVYEEVEARGWELYTTAMQEKNTSEANKALSTVMTARDKHMKLMMDIGLVKRASIDHNHKVEGVSPFLENWKASEKQEMAAYIVTKQLPALEEPVPPQNHEEDLPSDAEWESIEDEEGSNEL